MFNPKPPNDVHFRMPLQCIWLKLNGSWPLNPVGPHLEDLYWRAFGFFYRLWSRYVLISVGVTIMFQTAFLFNTFGDIIMTTENCCTTFMGVLNFIRLLHLHFNQHQFKEIIEQFVKNIWIVKNTHPKIERLCERNMNTFRVMTFLLTCLILMYLVLPMVELISVGFDSPNKPFPYKMMFPYNAQHGWRYVFTYIFTSYAGLCVVTTLFAEDSLFGFFVTYTCGQFRVLHEHIADVVPEANQHVLTQVGEQNTSLFNHRIQFEYKKRLRTIAFTHAKLIQFANSLEHFFSPILLANFLISSILICMVGFQLVTGKDMFIGDYIKFIIYISSALSQLYVLCWNGDTLIQCSTDTANHLFECTWEGEMSSENPTNNSFVNAMTKLGMISKKYEKRYRIKQFPPPGKEFRTNLQFMIMCSQRPVRITALKFSTLSLQSFRRILSTSMSYFTLLQTVYKQNQ